MHEPHLHGQHIVQAEGADAELVLAAWDQWSDGFAVFRNISQDFANSQFIVSHSFARFLFFFFLQLDFRKVSEVRKSWFFASFSNGQFAVDSANLNVRNMVDVPGGPGHRACWKGNSYAGYDTVTAAKCSGSSFLCP